MADYIERGALRKALSEADGITFDSLDVFDSLEIVDSIPSADVAPVVHGKWEDSIAKYGILIHKCSVCNKYSHMAYNYCPNCGVKMDGGKDDGMDS